MGTRSPVSSRDRFPVEERICTTAKMAITMPYVIKLFFVVLFIVFFISATSYFLLDVLAEQSGWFYKQHDDQNCKHDGVCNLRRNICLTEDLDNSKKDSSYHGSRDRSDSAEYGCYEPFLLRLMQSGKPILTVTHGANNAAVEANCALPAGEVSSGMKRI